MTAVDVAALTAERDALREKVEALRDLSDFHREWSALAMDMIQTLLPKP